MEQYYLKIGDEGGTATKGPPPINDNAYHIFSTDNPSGSKGYVFHVDNEYTWYDTMDEDLRNKSIETVNQGNFCTMGTFMVILPE